MKKNIKNANYMKKITAQHKNNTYSRIESVLSDIQKAASQGKNKCVISDINGQVTQNVLKFWGYNVKKIDGDWQLRWEVSWE